MITTTSWFDYLRADPTSRLTLDREQAHHQETLAEMRAQTIALQDLAILGVEQVKGLATVATEVAGVRGEVAGVRNELKTMGALFDWRLGQVIEEFRLQTARLDNLDAILRNPLGTQAMELWRRAQFAAERGWTEEAVKAYNESLDKDPYLYPAYLQLGFIHAYQRFDFAAAAEAFAKAGRYAEHDDPASAVEAFLHLQKVEREAGQTDQAWEHVSHACALDPEVSVAWWDRATLAASSGRTEMVVPNLAEAIQRDPLYWHRAKDHAWGASQSEVDRFLDQRYEEVAKLAPTTFASFKKDITDVEQSLRTGRVRLSGPQSRIFGELRQRLDQIGPSAVSNSYALQRTAVETIRVQQQMLAKDFREILNYVKIERERLEENLIKAERIGSLARDREVAELGRSLGRSAYVGVAFVAAVALSIAGYFVAVNPTSARVMIFGVVLVGVVGLFVYKYFLVKDAQKRYQKRYAEINAEDRKRNESVTMRQEMLDRCIAALERLAAT